MKQDTVFIYNWHIDNKQEEFTKLRAYALDKNNNNVCLHVSDFTPYVYLELPTHYEWNERKAQLLGNRLDEELGQYAPLKKCLIMKHKLYGAHIDSNGKRKLFPYLFCSFANRMHISRYLGPRLRKPISVQGIGHVRMKIHEGDADQILQLISCRDIPSVGWVKFIGDEVTTDEKVTYCEREYNVKWKGLYNADKNLVGRPLIMGFDIEVNSVNPAMMPKAKNPGDKVFQISCVFNREGTIENELYLLTLGQANSDIIGMDTKIISYDTEAELLKGFTQLVQEKNPNVICGYNILGFDIQYMIDRAKLNYCISDFDKLGFHKFNHSQEKKIKWSSSAFKTQEFDYLDAEGRIFVDLLPLIQRDYKFSNYKLGTVSQEILKDDKKDDLSIRKMFKYYRIGTVRKKDGTYSKKSIKAMSLIGRYCLKDSELCVKLMKKMDTWTGLTEFAKTVNTGIFGLYTQGQQIKVYSQVYKYCLKNNIVVEKDGYVTKEGERYAGAHVFPPVPGLYDRVLPFDFCLTGDTLVTLSNGTSKRIDSLNNDELVLGYNKEGFQNFSTINGLQKKGLKETIKIYLEDGKTITSTPDHKFMLENGEWCRADELKDKYVMAGIEYPEDIKCNIEHDWKLEVEDYTFTMHLEEERNKSLIFARIIGYILSDGSIYKTGKCSEAYFGTLIDAENFKNDIKKLSRIEVTIRKRETEDIERSKKGTTFSITLPSSISKMIHSLDDIIIGKRSTQSMKLPKFILEDNCPLSIIREFLGGLYGGDGTAPFICKRDTFGTISFKWTTIEKHVDSLVNVFNQIKDLQLKIGITSTIYKPILIQYENEENPKYELSILLEDIHIYSQKIGFRYCVNKTCKLQTSSSYIKNPIKINENTDIDTNVYAIKTDDLFIPSFKQKVIDIRPNGIQEVFDIEVNEIHNFLANGIVTHNCSLYPTTMIAYNFDYSTLVPDDSNIPDSKCNVISFSDHFSCQHDPKVIKVNDLSKQIDKQNKYLKELRAERDKKCNKLSRDEFVKEIDKKLEELKPIKDERAKIKKTILKKALCGERYYRFYKEQKGVVPTILQNLLDARKNTRIEIKKNKKEIEELMKNLTDENKDKINDLKILNAVLDKRQLAYKVSCNSAYGAYGVQKGYLPFMPGAMATTYMGRTNIEIVANTIQEKYGGVLVYGDSVTGDTPILCKINGKIVYRTIDNLPHSGWIKYRDEKEDADPDNIEVWTENGFTKIKKIIRHKTTKEIFRVLTHTGIVDVTEDHGLLDSNAEKISPKEIKVGSELLTSNLPIDCKYTFTGINSDLAFIMGLFYADGSCGCYERTNKQKPSTWALNNADRKLLEKCENILNSSKKDSNYELETLSFKILETMESSGVLKLVPVGKGIVSFVKIWRDLFYDKEKYKKVPDEILWSNNEVRQSFLDGYYAGDGDKDKHGYYRFDNKGKIGASGLYFLASSLGYNVSINIRKDKPSIYRITCTKNPQRKKENVVKKIESLGNTEQYVYDLETENHHFSAGVGKLIVHNTDCVVSTEPVMIQNEESGKAIIDYKTVEELSDGNWTQINPNKEISKAKTGYKIWSDQGFTNIVNVVRCGIKKPLSRVLTHVGVVNCSNEHSLLRENLESVTPSDVKIGDKLCISELPLPDDTPKCPIYNNKLTTEVIENYEIPIFEYEGLTAELAFVWGLFFADGSCGTYICSNGYEKSTWAINNQDNKLLERCCDILIRNEKIISFKILDTMSSSHVNKLVAKQFSKTSEHAGIIVTFVNKYRELFYDNRKYKKIPCIIFNSPLEIRQSFFMGYYAGDGSKKDPAISLSNKGSIGSAGLFYLMRSIGYQVSINTRTDKPDIYKLTGSNPEKKQRYTSNAVKKITPIKSNENEYIYDIQTENHHFAAGVGELVVHNSNYITFPHIKTAHESWDYAEKVAEEVSRLFPDPISLAFEDNIYWQFLILSKKRYMYKACGKDGVVEKKIGKKGVLLARRDNSVFVRKLYEEVINRVFDKVNRDDLLYFILQELNKLFSNSLDYKNFVVTKAVGDTAGFSEKTKESQYVIPFKDEKGKIKGKIGTYTVPLLSEDPKERENQLKKKNALTAKEFYEKCLPAQVVLSQKIKRRGGRVENGARLEYLIVESSEGHKGKQYEKIEDFDYFKIHSNIIKVDYFYYLEVLINPLDEVLNVVFGKHDKSYQYQFVKDFTQQQFDFRYKIRNKMMLELKSLFKPKLLFVE
jgi:DNA polymerase elongation subunit (family B)